MGNPVPVTQLPVTITSNLSQSQLLTALQMNFQALVQGLQATQGYCNNSVAPVINLSMQANSEILGSQIAGFARPSVAVTEEGVQVQTHIPRYEQIDTNDFLYGLLMEEGTVNLITDPAFAVPASWPIVGNLTFSSTGGLQGGTCIHLCQGVSATGYCYQTQSYSGWTNGSISCYVRMSDGSVPVLGTSAGQVNFTVGNYQGVAASLSLVGKINGVNWYRMTSSPLSGTVSGNTGPAFYGSNGTVYAIFSNIQLENIPATSWINGTRSPETMIIPTAGIFTPGSWTVEMKYIPKTIKGAYQFLWAMMIGSPANNWQLGITSSGEIYLAVGSGGNQPNITATSSVVVGQEYNIMIAGNGTTMILCINGIQIGSAAYIEPAGMLPTTMEIGCNTLWVSGNQCDGILDDLRISNIAHNITDHQNYISSNAPHPVDANTTLLMEFDQTLRQTAVNRLTNVQGAFTIADALTTNNPATATHIVPTGWTTAEATIMQAMSELPATGGSITLLDGTFIIDDQLVIFISAITLTGQGASTIIKLNAAIVQSSTFGLVINNPSISTTGITLSNFTLNNYSYSYQATNDREDAIYGLSFAPSGVALDGNTSALTIASLTINGFAQNGMNIFSTGAIVTNNIVQNNNNGINIGGNSYTLSGNTAQNNGSWGIITTGTYANISNNQVSNNGMHGLVIEGSHNTISGNTCQGNGQDGVSSNIYLMATASYNNIQGNTCRTGTNAVKPKYGIDISVATCVANLISSNDCYTGGVTAGISDSGTTTSFGAGNRVNSGAWSTTPS